MSSEASRDHWRKCNICKKAIGYRQEYWVCNVSTCNRKRTGLIFCTVSCWDAHVPMMNHRESWAEERRAPTFEEWEKLLKGEGERKPRERRPKTEVKAPEDSGGAGPATAPKVILRRQQQ